MTIRTISVSALAVAALLASVGGSFAATAYPAAPTAPATTPAPSAMAPAKPATSKVTFTTGTPGQQLSVADLTTSLSKYDPAMLKDFDSAKNVKVFNITKAYTGADKTAARALLTTDKATIAELRKDIEKDPTALRMLRANKIRPGQVVDIVDQNGQVSLYIS